MADPVYLANQQSESTTADFSFYKMLRVFTIQGCQNQGARTDYVTLITIRPQTVGPSDIPAI